MSTVKELTLSPAGTVAEPDEPDEDDEDDEPDEDVGADEDDEQPAAIRAATAATATQPNREMGLFLLPSSIQIHLSPQRARIRRRGTPEHECPPR
jgi:hypothetical protein